ncbi:MAG TPA: amino acid adenylation domain-containing protein, partial [Pyrinomonadaceae bacterium]|nr:amino acid adenylation domain-containing protein [Pyrinomonadaceae bacterium]
FIAWLHQQDADSAETYWRATLEGRTAPTAIEVGKAAPNAETDSPDYDEQEISFTADETQRLHEAAKRLHVTVNTLVQGAWGLLLSRYSNEADVIFGVTSSGRPPSLHGVEKIVGIFINTLPTRVRVPPEASVGGWLQELQARQAEQRQFEYSTLAQVHGWSEIPRSMRLFDSILVYENYPPYDFERGGGGGGQLEVGDIHAHGRTNYPLTVLAKGTSELLLKMWYDTSRFDDSTISRMLGHLRRIIQSLSSDAEQRLADVDILSEPEREQLLVEWNSPQTSYPATACIHELFEQQAARRPDAVALVSDEASLTYAELNARANRLAHHLRASGVGAEARVGLMLERSPEMVVALLAVLKAGGAYVPLDPSYPDERLSFLLGDAGLHTLVTVQKFADRTGSARANVVLLDADADQLASQPEDNPAQLTHPDNLAYIIYTSGSTGQPKGALVTHENITRLFAATEQYYKFDAADVWTLFHSYAFDFSVWELWGALAYGGRLVVVSHAVSRAPEEFYELLVRERVTVLNQTPSAFRQLMSAEESAGAGQQLALRFVIFGGEALELSSLKPWFERHGDERPRLVNMYGITETTVHVTYRPLTFADARSGGGSRIGVALPDLQVYVLDRELRPVPVGVPGELYVGGAGVARGYLNQAALTAERFIPHPYSAQPGARLYRSGDLARFLPGGDLEYLGRNDQQVKIRGFRIEPGEVEAALREQSGIEDCAVMVRESAEGEKRLVAYCVRRGGAEFAELSAGQLRAQLKQRLPDYMLPAQVVMLDALPLTPNGKVDRKALTAVESVESEPDTKFSAPRTPVEELLASIWASVLDVERVGRDDEFFELGGHSLLATQIMSRVRETFNVEVPLSALFENSTPSGLAMRIEEAMRAGEGISTAPLKPVSREQILPLSFAQQRLWFLDQLEPGSFFYNIPAVLRLNGRLDISVLERTLTEITRRHEVLRSTFVAT